MSTTIFRFGDIVLVPFPFTDQTSSKKRPAVVVSNPSFHHHHPDIILMAVTSQIRAILLTGETLIRDWTGAGLLKPSVVKPVLMTVDTALILRRLGRLGDSDRQAVTQSLALILGER